MYKVEDNTDYEIVKFLVEKGGQSEILQEGLLFINKQPSTETKTLMFSLKAKQKGRFGLVMSQMQSKTGFINICVGDTLEEAQELCKERKPTSTIVDSVETNNASNEFGECESLLNTGNGKEINVVFVSSVSEEEKSVFRDSLLSLFDRNENYSFYSIKPFNEYGQDFNFFYYTNCLSIGISDNQVDRRFAYNFHC